MRRSKGSDGRILQVQQIGGPQVIVHVVIPGDLSRGMTVDEGGKAGLLGLVAWDGVGKGAGSVALGTGAAPSVRRHGRSAVGGAFG